MNKKKVSSTISILIIIIALVILYLGLYIQYYFIGISFEQLIYSIINTEGTSIYAMKDGIIFVGGLTIVSLAFIIIIKKILTNKLKNKKDVNFKIKEKNYKIQLHKNNQRKILICSILLLIISIIYVANKLGLIDYVMLQKKESKIFEQEYVDPKTVNVEFPEIKKNLIYIYVESLEMSAISKKNGGNIDGGYIPNLEYLALNNLNFSNKELLGGAVSTKGSTWTAASMISQTSGVPLKVQMNIKTSEEYGALLPGVYSLGEILENNGYNNYLMMGSDANYAGRADYFKLHGNYTIYDYNYAISNKWIDKNYYEWWGFEDRKLFKYAKQQLSNISKNQEPFNFTLLTADTHFYDGYQDKECNKKTDNDYANSHLCSDQMIYNFIKWVQEQDFYQNTVIIITGDHLTMQDNFYSKDEYQRTIYNTFINSVDTNNNKNRLFSLLDMYPTTLASLGVKIENNKLGLGTNLFSNEKTILEKYGVEYINNELSKKSNYYENKLVKR